MEIQQRHTSSELENESQMSLTSASPDHARVSVQLSNGIKLLVPILQTAHVHDLHRKTLDRAAKFGVQTEIEDSFLQTTGPTVVALTGEDLLKDVWDWTENATFTLCDIRTHAIISQTLQPGQLLAGPAANPSVPPNTTDVTTSATTSSSVYMQLYTLEETISSAKLSWIESEPLICSDEVSLAQLYKTISARYHQRTPITPLRPGDPQLKLPKISLYLQQCQLAADKNVMSLRDLKLAGSKSMPLRIFVDIDASDNALSNDKLPDDAQLKNLWGFPTTRRGVCTFITSLEILIQNIRYDTCAQDDFMRSLLETTNFPPLVIAFKDLCTGHVGYKLRLSQMRMLAQAIHLLCLQTAPTQVCKVPDNALEASRQVISWMCSLRPDSSAKKDDEIQSMVRSVQIWSKDDNDTDVQSSTLPHTFCTEMSIETSLSLHSTKLIGINLSEDDKALATFLGRVLYESRSVSHEHYIVLDADWEILFDQDKVFPPQPMEFNALIESTGNSVKFRMIGPDKLAKCISTDLPVITLDINGYVTVYDQEDYECGSQRFFTWNAKDGKVIMNKGNPGQYLMQKLTPIIAKRQQTETWIVDAWTDWIPQADFGTPDEAIVVCMDTSFSMSIAMPGRWSPSCSGIKAGNLPSRLTEVKEFFKNFASRISALQLSTYLGLVTFSSRALITTRQDLTPVHLDFEDQMEWINPQEDTAIYDGIEEARRMLCDLKAEHENVKCRIVVLTDGEDNNSSVDPVHLAQRMCVNNIVLDTIVIGNGITYSRELFKISRSTGGYAFAPTAQATLFQIFLLETMVDIRTRPDIVQTPVQAPAWESFTPKSDDMRDTYHFPPSRPHPNQSDYFIALKDAERYLTRQKSSSPSQAASVHSSMTRTTSSAFSNTTLGSSGASRVILAEVKEMVNNPHSFMDVYVSESNMGFWIVAMQGPPNSPYSEGTFKLYLELGKDFPLRPPSARFITPMLHPNITKHGRICHPILDREWTGTTRVYQVLQHIWGILMSLEARDAVDPLSTLKFWTDPVQGRLEVERYVRHFASTSRAAIREELQDNDASTLCSSAASIKSQSTVTGGRYIATPTSSVTSTASPSYQSAISPTTRRPALLSNLLALRSNRPTAAPSPPPLMMMPGQETGGPQARRQDPDAISTASSIVSDGSKKSSRRKSFFKKISK